MSSNTLAEIEALTRALAAPFEANEIKFKPAVVSGNRALALAYVDARVIQDRLDETVGVANWQDEYVMLPDGSCFCTLRIRLGGEWITKMDVGGASEQPDEGDRHKAAVSDALKRTAVKFGIGRFLYRLPSQWCDYDPQKRQFVKPPKLPDSFMPKPEPTPKPQPAALNNVVQKWVEWLGSNPSLDNFNTNLPDIAELEEADKKAVKKLLSRHAEGRGWILDREQKVFVLAQKVGGAA
jgi:hypothetical protein